MSYTVPTGAILEISFRSSIFNETILNIFHYRMLTTLGSVDGISTADSFVDMWDNITTGFSAKHMDWATTDVKYEQIVAQWIHPTRYARITYTPTNPHGENDPPTLPTNSSAVTTKRTNLAGRIGLGSIHWAGHPTASVLGNRIVQGIVDSMEATAGAALKTFALSADVSLFPIIWPRKAPFVPVDVTGYTTSTEPRTMRRRGVRLGI